MRCAELGTAPPTVREVPNLHGTRTSVYIDEGNSIWTCQYVVELSAIENVLERPLECKHRLFRAGLGSIFCLNQYLDATREALKLSRASIELPGANHYLTGRVEDLVRHLPA